jgi:hypothetical protein
VLACEGVEKYVARVSKWRGHALLKPPLVFIVKVEFKVIIEAENISKCYATE